MEVAESFDFTILWNFLITVIFHLVTFGVAIYYIIRRQSIDGFLIAGGAFIHILTTTFYSLVLPIVARTSGTQIYHHPFLSVTVSVIGFIGSLIYITGLVILIFNHISLHQKFDKVKSID